MLVKRLSNIRNYTPFLDDVTSFVQILESLLFANTISVVLRQHFTRKNEDPLLKEQCRPKSHRTMIFQANRSCIH